MLKCKRIRTIIPIESRTQINDCLKLQKDKYYKTISQLMPINLLSFLNTANI